MKTIELTKELLQISSESGKEKEIGKFLLKRLKRNFNVKIQKVDNRFNILASIGKPEILLTTHIDTVPKQLEVREDKNYLYGRGACDTKSIIVCMIIAGEEAINTGIRNFGILFDVSEETDFSGIKEAVKLVTPKIIIVGEPTDFKLATGQKGLLGIKIKCFGKNAPGSTPEKGRSAINRLIEILYKINKIKLPNNKILGKTSLNIGKINGGIAANVVPDYAEAIIEFRTIKKNEYIMRKIKNLVKNKEFQIIYNFEPVINKGNLPKILKFKKIIVPYFTEMYFWNKSNVFVFGPGKYKFAHSDIEKIRKVDVENGKNCYLKILKILSNKESYINKFEEVNSLWRV